MGSKQGEDIDAERGGDIWRKFPESLIIVGKDKTEEELLALYPGDSRADQNARAAIVSCRDLTRLEEPAQWWAEQLALGTSLPPIECYRLPPDIRGKVRVIVFKGRHRTMGVRENNRGRRKAERQRVDIKLLPLVTGKMTRGGALISQAGSNHHVPMSLETRAMTAVEMQQERLDAQVIVTMLAEGGGQPVIDNLLAWGAVFPLLCEEAVRRANAGTLTLTRARRIATLPSAEQEAELARPRVSSRRPSASLRQIRALATELDVNRELPVQFSRAEVLSLVRTLSGEQPSGLMKGALAEVWKKIAGLGGQEE